MRHHTRTNLTLWGTAGAALAFYALTAPDGLPWDPDANRYWRHLVALTGGNAAVLTSVMAAAAAGWIGSFVKRFYGWRAGGAAALLWMFIPWVWNGAITGGRGVFFLSCAIGILWVAAGIFWSVTRKARRATAALRARQPGGAKVAEVDSHRRKKRHKKLEHRLGRLAWGLAAFLAVVSIGSHEWRYGETASAFAKLVVDEADGRTVVLNGVADAQILRELSRRVSSGRGPASVLPLRNSEISRSNLVASAQRQFPGETNLWLAARVSPAAFADRAVRAHPDRLYVMTGLSTTPEKWMARWKAMQPYLETGDPFIPALRRAFAFEGNVVGNRLRSTDPLSKKAWDAYWCVFDEIEPGNPAACVNLDGMLRAGYAAGEAPRRRIAATLAEFADLPEDGRLAVEAALRLAAFGPVIRDEKDYEKLRVRAAARMDELARSGVRPDPAPDFKTLEDWHAEMMTAYYGKDLDRAALFARAILSRSRWHGFLPAHMVMGTVLAARGDDVAAEAFYRAALKGKGAATPAPFVYNDYAEVLRRLGRLEEAEKYARLALAKSKGPSWIFRLTLAQILRDRKAAGCGDAALETELQALVRDVLRDAPAQARPKIRREF